jgi:hypothetical protein
MKVTKTQKIIDWFVKHPSSDVKVVAKKFDAAVPMVYKLRKRAMNTDVVNEAVKEVFEPRADFSISDHIQAMPTPELLAEVRFTSLALDRARREWWLGMVSERETPLGTVLTLASADWERLTGWLLSFGQDAEVLSPESLRRGLVKAAMNMAEHHRKKPKPC